MLVEVEALLAKATLMSSFSWRTRYRACGPPGEWSTDSRMAFFESMLPPPIPPAAILLGFASRLHRDQIRSDRFEPPQPPTPLRVVWVGLGRGHASLGRTSRDTAKHPVRLPVHTHTARLEYGRPAPQGLHSKC